MWLWNLIFDICIYIKISYNIFFIGYCCMFPCFYLYAVGIDTWTKHRLLHFIHMMIHMLVPVSMCVAKIQISHPRDIKYLIDHDDVLWFCLYACMLSSIKLMKAIFSCVSQTYCLFRFSVCIMFMYIEGHSLLCNFFFFQSKGQSDIVLLAIDVIFYCIKYTYHIYV